MSSIVSLNLYCFLGTFLNKSFLVFELSSGTSTLAFYPIMRLCVIELLLGRCMP